MRRNIKTTNDETVSEELIALLVEEHRNHTRPTLQRLWDYYRNELDFTGGDEHRPYRAAQQRGLPDRLTRKSAGSGRAVRSIGVGGGRREVVIENDIAWRVHTLVDFMFGRPVVIQSRRRTGSVRTSSSACWTWCSRTTGASASFRTWRCWGVCTGLWM